ncbi:MAG: LytR family transcriptional regulator [Clostridium butyricum]|nr:LytR family transcriptional regulator [Clostridium butyricum]
MGRKKKHKKEESAFSKMEKFFLRSVSLILALVVFSVVSAGIALFKISNNSMPDGDSPGVGESLNILLMGVDIGDVNQVENQSIKRTDTLMVLNYNPKTKGVNLVSVPRDTLININGSHYKINSAYALGGYSRLETEVENLLNININYIVRIDYNAFREFIDAIGGVEMTIDQDMYYDDEGQNLHINFKAGETVKLDGKKAEEFFRWRKNNDGTGLVTGDLGRIENQQKFIAKVVDKCKSPMMIFRLPGILNAFADNIETNIPSYKAVGYGLKFLLHSSNMNMTTITGDLKMIGGQSYVIFNQSYNTDIINALGENADSSENSSINYNARIKVLNGTNINGLASKVKEKLVANGYTNIDVGNTVDTEKSRILSNDSPNAKKIKKIVDVSKIDKKEDKPEYNDYDAIIIIGNDYDDKF